MARRWWKRLLIAAGAVLPLVVVYDRFLMIRWVGSTDLEVELVVTEAGTGSPIPGARVEVQSEGGFYEERERQEFALLADDAGVARKVCRESMCFGSTSGLGFTDTYAVHLPFRRVRVVAPGYEPGEWMDLDVLDDRRAVQRVGPRRAKLVVPVSLSRVEAGAPPR